MSEQTERTYNIKPQDFIPFVGSFIYSNRNWKEAGEKQGTQPEPYNRYHATGSGLTVLNFTTGFASMYAILKGLEALINKIF